MVKKNVTVDGYLAFVHWRNEKWHFTVLWYIQFQDSRYFSFVFGFRMWWCWWWWCLLYLFPFRKQVAVKFVFLGSIKSDAYFDWNGLSNDELRLINLIQMMNSTKRNISSVFSFFIFYQQRLNCFSVHLFHWCIATTKSETFRNIFVNEIKRKRPIKFLK